MKPTEHTMASWDGTELFYRAWIPPGGGKKGLLLFHRGHDTRMRMTEDQRPPRADVIEVAVAVDIDEESALAASDEGRLSANGAEGPRGTVDAAGDDLRGSLVQLARARLRGRLLSYYVPPTPHSRE